MQDGATRLSGICYTYRGTRAQILLGSDLQSSVTLQARFDAREVSRGCHSTVTRFSLNIRRLNDEDENGFEGRSVRSARRPLTCPFPGSADKTIFADPIARRSAMLRRNPLSSDVMQQLVNASGTASPYAVQLSRSSGAAAQEPYRDGTT